MRRTRVCELFGIDYPIIQAGMIWVSGGRLASAASEAGALGLIGAGSMTPELLRHHIRKARSLTAKPFGVNLPILYRHAEEMVPIILEEKIPVVFTSGGSPKTYTRRFKDAGCVVVHVTSTPTLARKCEDAGVDAVVAEGFEAGGHNGRDELTSFVLIPQVVDAVKIPVIAAGGIADGRGVAAAIALGADGVQVGSRFVASEEASCHPDFKKAVLNAGSEDTFLVLKSLVPVRLIKNDFCRRAMDAETRGARKESLSELLGHGRAQLGMYDGDLAEGELEIGQVSGMINEILPAAEIIHRLREGYEATLRHLG